MSSAATRPGAAGAWAVLESHTLRDSFVPAERDAILCAGAAVGEGHAGGRSRGGRAGVAGGWAGVAGGGRCGLRRDLGCLGAPARQAVRLGCGLCVSAALLTYLPSTAHGVLKVSLSRGAEPAIAGMACSCQPSMPQAQAAFAGLHLTKPGALCPCRGAGCGCCGHGPRWQPACAAAPRCW